MCIQLIVGLGNHGSQYASTRHNAGYWFAQMLCQQYQKTPQLESKFKALVCALEIHAQPCKILLPTTFMNHSGQAVLAIAQFYKIDPQQILVVHDELDLPAGTARFKFNGGHGGHNGLRDIMAQLGTREFYRLRIGIGHPGNKDRVHDYVLQKPNLSDKTAITHSLEDALRCLPDLVTGNFEKAMQTLHSISQ